MRNLGLSSYSLYLTHGPIVVVVYELVVAGRVRQGAPAFLVSLALVLPLTIVFARAFARSSRPRSGGTAAGRRCGAGLLGQSSWNRGERA